MRDLVGTFQHWMVVVIAAATMLLLVTPRAMAQGGQGQDAVYDAHTNVVGSQAFIDASMFISVNNPTICDALHAILNSNSYPATGALVDARGISGTTALTCAANKSPWTIDGNTTVLNVPSTILLPAGVIVIPTTWALPSNTRLIGEGDGIPSSTTGFAPGTTIRAVVPIGQLQTMIQYGASSLCSPVCTGISVEKLTLDGQAQSLHGIVNQFSQTNTYVDHVSIYQIQRTGLLVSSSGNSSATNSGPYTNITFDTGGYSGTSSTVCAQIVGTSGTRGIHGLRCAAETNDAPAAVLLDASANSIHDVTVGP